MKEVILLSVIYSLSCRPLALSGVSAPTAELDTCATGLNLIPTCDSSSKEIKQDSDFL